MRTAEHVSTTPEPLPVTSRALVIPHVLEPAEVEALIRVGENLADIRTRLAAMMARSGGPLNQELRDLAQACVEMADVVEPDPDLEPDADGEPSLGWTVSGSVAAGNSHFDLDCEQDADQEEGWFQPLRLDVALAGEEARHG